MSIIPKPFMNAVVAVGVETQNNQKAWIGTGFIVRRKKKNNSEDTFYLITNKHVVANQTQIFIQFNSLKGDFVKGYSINLYKGKENVYTNHPDPKTDVIAVQIVPQVLVNDQSIWGYFDLDEHALTLDQMRKTGVDEGSLVYALGFPMNLVDVIKSPICRLGCISRIQDAFVKLDAKENSVFLVDAQTFPGNSGGPIISRPETLAIHGTKTNPRANLIGILSAYIPYQDTLISQQTRQPVMIREENSGLTIVHPVDRIKEVVELEFKRQTNAKLANTQKKNGLK